MGIGEIILWLVFGGLAGWVASIIAGKNSQMGIGANIIVGIVGAFIGGFIVELLTRNDVEGFTLGSFIVAVLGATLLLYIVNWVSRTNRTHI